MAGGAEPDPPATGPQPPQAETPSDWNAGGLPEQQEEPLMSTTAPYRIEERVTQPDGPPAVTYADEYDDRGEALSHYAWLAHRSRFGAPYSVNADPDEDDFRPHSRRRLVLLGPDRIVLPAAITEGPGL